MLFNKKIIVIVAGGIAAYKSPEVVRVFKQAGAEVKVVMTKAAAEFTTALALQAVSGNFVVGDVVTLETTDGRCFARGLVNYGSNDLERIRGLKTDNVLKILGVCACDEVIHRDDLVVICREGSASQSHPPLTSES